VSGPYYYARSYGAILQYFQTKGGADAYLPRDIFLFLK